MRKSDFYERDLHKICYLKDWALVRRWACSRYNLTRSELELLLYLDPLRYFTKGDFETGVVFLPWNTKRWEKLYSEGFIMAVDSKNHKYAKGKKKRYVCTRNCRLMVNQIYRILGGFEPIPENSPLSKRKTRSDKVTSYAIEHRNQQNRDESKKS